MIYDVLIIGAGPSGLSTAIYASRAKLDTLVIEKESDRAGQISLTDEVVNYPGILKTSGMQYMKNLRQQTEQFGAKIVLDEVVDMDLKSDIKVIKTKSSEYKALNVVIATGASPRKLGFEGEEKFYGKGIAYCATCDGEFFTGLDIFVIGAGFAAAEEAMFLTKYAKKVIVIAREPEFTCAKSIADKVLAHPKIEVRFNTELVEILGDAKPNYAKFKNNKTGEISEYRPEEGKTFGTFIFVGYAPNSKLFADHINLDDYGFIPTNEDMLTSQEGVFAVGDIRPKKLRQLVTAVSDGAIAATQIEKVVEAQREKLGIVKQVKEAQKHETKELIDNELRANLENICKTFVDEVNMVLVSDASEHAKNMEDFLKDFCSISNKLNYKIYELGTDIDFEKKIGVNKVPCIALFDKNDNFKNIKYATVPLGHELKSFLLACYNIAGPGQKIPADTEEKIKKVPRKSLKIGISLSCTKCPQTVQSAQKMALVNENIDVEIINIFEFSEFKEKYNIMSVPVIVLDEKLYFGEKKISDILEII